MSIFYHCDLHKKKKSFHIIPNKAYSRYSQFLLIMQILSKNEFLSIFFFFWTDLS